MTDNEILQCLMDGGREMTVDQLAEQTGIPPWIWDKTLHDNESLPREAIAALVKHFDYALDDFDWSPTLGRTHRFIVREFSGGYDVLDYDTGDAHWLSDGVDVISLDPPDDYANEEVPLCGWTCYAGTFGLHMHWEHSLNGDYDQTLEAYWPDQYEKETG